MGRNIWDILSWIAFGIVMAYFILKALHILKSPEIIGIITILSAGYFVGRHAMKTDNDIRSIKTNVSNLGSRMSILEKSVSILEADMTLVKTTLKNISDKCFAK